MTVRDLLSHRCGLVTFDGDLLWYGSDYDDAEVLRAPRGCRSAALPRAVRLPEPDVHGRRHDRAAAPASSWEEFVEQRFFAPLGMTASRASAQRLPKDAEKAIPHIDGEVSPTTSSSPASRRRRSTRRCTN
jgi:CubicO group peptidase (beta-lactamase class C family)